MSDNKISIVIVIVLYNSNLNDSKSYLSFTKAIEDSKIDYTLILYNNSKEIEIPQNESYLVVNADSNQKLTGAYNYTLEYASNLKKKWILLLDQDTEITTGYFTELVKFFSSNQISNDTAAIVPFLKENNKILSPHKIGFFNCLRIKIKSSGYQKGYITAFNSLSLLHVDFMNSIGGFNTKYPLDFLDYWYYYQIFKFKQKVFVLDTIVNHELSLNNYESNISLARHTELLIAEKTFVKEMGTIHYCFYKIRLIFRLSKQLLLIKNKNYANIIFKILTNKL